MDDSLKDSQSEISTLELERSNDALPSAPIQVASAETAAGVFKICGTRTGWPMRLAYLAGDLIGIACGLLVTHLVHWLVSASFDFPKAVFSLQIEGLLSVGFLYFAASQGSYSPIPPRPVRQFRSWVQGAVALFAFLVLALWLMGRAEFGLIVHLGMATTATLLLTAFNRALCRLWFGKSDWWGTRVLVVGTESLATNFHLDLEKEPQWGLRPVGYIADDVPTQRTRRDARYRGSLKSLREVAREVDTDRAIMAVHAFDQGELAELLSEPSSPIRHWIAVPELAGIPSLWLQADETNHVPAFALTNHLTSPAALRGKRLLDLFVILASSIVLVPLVLTIALLSKLTSRGNLFYGHERVGKNGRRFKAWKFRTMHSHADRLLTEYLDQHPELADEWMLNHKLKNDPRVTRLGRFLRKTSLDEIPQLWNVLRGDMSLVGPRPIVAEEIEKYADSYVHYRSVAPGITGLWQVSGRNNTTYERRVQLDAYYARNWSIWLDLYILACTVKVVLLGEGAY